MTPHAAGCTPFPTRGMNSNPFARTAMLFGVLVGTGTCFSADQVHMWRDYVQHRSGLAVSAGSQKLAQKNRPDVRTVAEHIENIRTVLSPSVADLASVFEVSRQSIYKWLAGDSVPDSERLQKIQDFSRVADSIRESGVGRGEALIKMKAFEGQSLMDLIRLGMLRDHHVSEAIAEALAMEASYQRSGIAESRAPADSSWQSSISIPGGIERS